LVPGVGLEPTSLSL